MSPSRAVQSLHKVKSEEIGRHAQLAPSPCPVLLFSSSPCSNTRDEGITPKLAGENSGFFSSLSLSFSLPLSLRLERGCLNTGEGLVEQYAG
jgi:hypothetical protein